MTSLTSSSLRLLLVLLLQMVNPAQPSSAPALLPLLPAPADDAAFLGLLHRAQADLGLSQEYSCLPLLAAAPAISALASVPPPTTIDPDTCLATLRIAGPARSNASSIHSDIAKLYFDSGVAHLRGGRGQASRRAFHLSLIYAAVDYTAHGGEFIAHRSGLQWDDLIQHIFVETRAFSKHSPTVESSTTSPPPPPPPATPIHHEVHGAGKPSRKQCSTHPRTSPHDGSRRHASFHGDSQFAARRIAVVTLCAYDAADSPLASLSMHNKVEYAARHGYAFFGETSVADASRNAKWNMISLLQKYLQLPDDDAATARNKYDWVFWMDCDSFVMNPAVKLEDLLDRVLVRREGDVSSESGGSAREGPAADVLHGCGGEEEEPRVGGTDDASDGATASSAVEFVGPDLVLTEDGTMLNGGFVAVRNTRWSRHFLSTAWGDDSNMFIRHVWNEQATMQFIVHHMSPAQRHRHLRYLTQPECNAYAVEFTDSAVHEAYVAGDFIVAFSGCRTFLSAAECNTLIRRYASSSGVWGGRTWRAVQAG